MWKDGERRVKEEKVKAPRVKAEKAPKAPKVKAEKPPRKPMKRKTANALAGYAFLAPWLIGFLMFSAFPLLYSLYISLSQVSVTTNGVSAKFIGFTWYQSIFAESTTFLTNLLDSLQFVLFSTPIIVVCALVIAMLLNSKFRGRTFFRALFFFPVIITSGPVISELINNNAAAVINATNFTIYGFVASLPEVLSVPILYIFDNIVVILWFSGVQILIYLSGLQKIGRPIYEAASIDGASSWQVFWKIVLPFIRPTILLNVVYTIMELSSFSNNAINGEITGNMTLTKAPYSYSAAMSWVYFLCIAVLLLVGWLLLRERKRRRV